MAKLGTLGKIITGNTPTTSDEQNYASSDISFVKPSDINSNDVTLLFNSEYYISEYAREKARILPPNSVLVTCIGIIGKVAINAIECAFNQQINAIMPDPSKCLPEYVAYAIYHKQHELQTIANAPVVPILNKSQFSDIEIYVPSLQEQQNIVDTLTAISRLISLRKQQLAKLDELVKARFVEMFEQKNYPTIEFGDICVFLRNGANIKQTKGAAGYPITRIETLANDRFNSDRLGYANIFDLTKFESYLLKQGDILISHINSVSYLGRAVQYHGELQSPVIHGMNLLCARIKGQDATYIEWYLKCNKAKSYIATITKKAVNQASITTTDLRKLPVVLPPLELQRQFSSFVAQIDKQKLTIQQSLDKLELMKKALMQKYFG